MWQAAWADISPPDAHDVGRFNGEGPPRGQLMLMTLVVGLGMSFGCGWSSESSEGSTDAPCARRFGYGRPHGPR